MMRIRKSLFPSTLSLGQAPCDAAHVDSIRERQGVGAPIYTVALFLDL